MINPTTNINKDGIIENANDNAKRVVYWTQNMNSKLFFSDTQLSFVVNRCNKAIKNILFLVNQEMT
jgi:hypothetical protein